VQRAQVRVVLNAARCPPVSASVTPEPRPGLAHVAPPPWSPAPCDGRRRRRAGRQLAAEGSTAESATRSDVAAASAAAGDRRWAAQGPGSPRRRPGLRRGRGRWRAAGAGGRGRAGVVAAGSVEAESGICRSRRHGTSTFYRRPRRPSPSRHQYLHAQQQH